MHVCKGIRGAGDTQCRMDNTTWMCITEFTEDLAYTIYELKGGFVSYHFVQMNRAM